MAISIQATLTLLERQQQQLRNSLVTLVREELEEIIRDDGDLLDKLDPRVNVAELNIHINFDDLDNGESMAELITRQRLALDAVTAAIVRLRELEALQEEMGAP